MADPKISLLTRLGELRYAFVTPTPASHGRILARRRGETARDLRDALGWSLPFQPGTLDAEVEALLAQAGLIQASAGGRVRSAARVSSLEGRLYLHSAYPTLAKDAVFFGPDSYRFAALIRRTLQSEVRSIRRVLDIGTGSGVGLLTAADFGGPAAELVGTDVNGRALEFASAAAAAAGRTARFLQSGRAGEAGGDFDVVLANPPYLMDEEEREYRHGGGADGAEMSLSMTRQGLDLLAPGGVMILYTGSAIRNGSDPVRRALELICETRGCALQYDEIDPDVFGEELEKRAYAGVERIALVGAVMRADVSG